MKEFMIDMSKVDWPLLREQKLRLLKLIAGSEKRNKNKEVSSLRGIVSLIDYLQDSAARNEMWTEEEIFGKLGEGEKNDKI